MHFIIIPCPKGYLSVDYSLFIWHLMIYIYLSFFFLLYFLFMLFVNCFFIIFISSIIFSIPSFLFIINNLTNLAIFEKVTSFFAFLSHIFFKVLVILYIINDTPRGADLSKNLFSLFYLSYWVLYIYV